MDEKGKFQLGALKYLYEMELVDDPQLINNLKMNILMTSKRIKEVEFLISYHTRQILVYIDVSWVGKKFFLNRIKTDIYDILTQLLPNFKFRVTSNYDILELARQRVNEVMAGGSDEEGFNNSSTGQQFGNGEDELQKESDILSNKGES